MTKRRRNLLVFATAAVSLTLAAWAAGATRSLTYRGCIANSGLDGCREPPHNSFGNSLGIAVSPDGASVYVVGYEGTLTVLRHDAADALGYEQCFADGGAHDCRDIAHDSLDAGTGVAVSPDGRSIYVTSAERTNAVTRFKRDAAGRLTYRGCIANGGRHAGLSSCRQPSRNSLDSNEAVAVSPDGKSVYVVSSGSDSITRFKRERNGALRYRGCIANRGGHGCEKPKHDSLGGAFDVAVSPDGRSVYVVSLDGSGLTRFNRKPNGSLVYKSCFANDGAHGCRKPRHQSLRGADAVAVAPDGKSVYVAALNGDSITHFKRSPGGRLEAGGCYANGGGHGCREPAHNALHAADGVAVSPDGEAVYVSAMTGPQVNGGAGAVSEFKRRAGGSIAFAGCFADHGKYDCHEPRLDSLGSPESIAVDPDGTAVFVGSFAHQLSLFGPRKPSP